MRIFCQIPHPKTNTISAYIKNAIWINQVLENNGHKVDTFYANNQDKINPEAKYDLFISHYGSSFFRPHRKLQSLFNNNDNSPFVWIANEYDVSPNSFFRNQMIERTSYILANYEFLNKFKAVKNKVTKNLNLILFNDSQVIKEKKYNHIYFGTHRPDRRKYHEIYLKENIYLSCKNKNSIEFKRDGSKSPLIKELDINRGDLSLFRYSLYIEDVSTHKRFNNLSNRFYENLGNNVVTIFDENCLANIRKSGLVDYEDFIVSCNSDLDKFTSENYERFMNVQMKWKDEAIQQRINLEKDIVLFFKDVGHG
tara:strand:- start:4085 stop:5014 length:930 start_codon:yes stop_codon:yes gene_type:complete